MEEALELKKTLLSEINNVDRNDTEFWKKLRQAVTKILVERRGTRFKDEITPFVKSMEVGMKLPDNLDVKALRDEYYNKKYL